MKTGRTLLIAACIVLVALVATSTVATALTVSGISPKTAGQGTTITAHVTGTGINPGSQVKLVGGGKTIVAKDEKRLSSTKLKCTIAVPLSAYVGTYTVYVQNPGKAWVSRAGAFKVTKKVPGPGTAITGIEPASADRGTTIAAVIAGSGFTSGMKVRLKGGSTTIYGTGVTTIGTNAIRCTLVIPATAYIGSYAVAVQKPGTSAWVSKNGIFRVTNPPPVPVTIKSLSPGSADPSKPITLRVYGTGFLADAQVKLTSGGTTIEGTTEVTVNSGQISCTIAVSSSAPRGWYTVWVQNPGQAWVSKADAFKVNDPSPPEKPDLRRNAFDAPSGTLSSRTFSIYNGIWNIGKGAAGPFTVSYYLSKDTMISGSDYLIGTRTFSGLAGGTWTPTGYSSFTIPQNVPGGTYYAGMIIDSSHAVAESDESNNIEYDPVPLIVPGQPDLANFNIDAYKVTWPGLERVVYIKNTLMNYGTAPAGPFTVRYYASKDDHTITNTDVYLGYRTYSGIPANSQGPTVTEDFTWPSGAPNGIYYIGGIIDYYNQVSESYETNNVVYDITPLAFYY